MYISCWVVLLIFAYLSCSSALVLPLNTPDNTPSGQLSRVRGRGWSNLFKSKSKSKSYSGPSYSGSGETSSSAASGARLNRILIVAGDSISLFRCDASQVAAIDRAISTMRKNAAGAYNFLREDNSHTTAAYIGWFGASHADRDKAKEIMNDVYHNIYQMGETSAGYVRDLSAVDGALKIACATKSVINQCEKAIAMADTHNDIVYVCEAFFEPAPSEEEWRETWRNRRFIQKHGLPGQTLLHEMTHLSGVVGSYITVDVVRSGHLASLMYLSDEDKIRSAENYARFAGEIFAGNPNADAQVDLNSYEKAYQIAQYLLRKSADGATEAREAKNFDSPMMVAAINGHNAQVAAALEAEKTWAASRNSGIDHSNEDSHNDNGWKPPDNEWSHNDNGWRPNDNDWNHHNDGNHGHESWAHHEADPINDNNNEDRHGYYGIPVDPDPLYSGYGDYAVDHHHHDTDIHLPDAADGIWDTTINYIHDKFAIVDAEDVEDISKRFLNMFFDNGS